MRVWVDITDASHVVFFAPIVRRLEDAGHVVTVTARRFAGADVVLRRYGLGGVLTTGHRGGSLGTRAVGLVNRTAQLIGSASSGRFDVAAGSHASDFVLAAWTLGIPQLTFLDDERARARQLPSTCAWSTRWPCPTPSRRRRWRRSGLRPDKLFRYPGFTEEYYLYDVRPDPGVLGPPRPSTRTTSSGVVRPPRRPRQGGGPGPARAPPPPSAPKPLLLDLVGELAGRRNVLLVLVARDAGAAGALPRTGAARPRGARRARSPTPSACWPPPTSCSAPAA